MIIGSGKKNGLKKDRKNGKRGNAQPKKKKSSKNNKKKKNNNLQKYEGIQ